jgi:hypothetical protein
LESIRFAFKPISLLLRRRGCEEEEEVEDITVEEGEVEVEEGAEEVGVVFVEVGAEGILIFVVVVEEEVEEGAGEGEETGESCIWARVFATYKSHCLALSIRVITTTIPFSQAQLLASIPIIELEEERHLRSTSAPISIRTRAAAVLPIAHALIRGVTPRGDGVCQFKQRREREEQR